MPVLGRTLALAVLALGVTAGPASAAITSTYASGTLTVTGNGADDTVAITCTGTTVRVNGANPDTGSLACSTPDSIVADGGGGADTLEVVSPPGPSKFPALDSTTLAGGEGSDELTGDYIGSPGYVGTLLGGPGDDVLVKAGNIVVRGGSGDDRLVGTGGPGTTFDGEEGSDEVFIDISTGSTTQLTLIPEDAGITVEFAGQPSAFLTWTSIERVDALLNDGQQTFDGAGFSGTVRVNGLGGPDTLTGGAGPDELSGGGGNDVLEGAGGADQHFGDSGDDLLRTRDAVADGGDCGPGADILIADAIDVVALCETVDLPPPLPAPPPGPAGPGTALAGATVKARWRVRRSRTTITRLRIGKIVSGTLVEVRCSGRRCPFTRKRTGRVRRGVINALALFAPSDRDALRAGQTLEIRVTAPGQNGKVVRFRLRRGKLPKRTTLCLPVGETRPRTSC